MIYILAILAAALVCFAWWMWRGKPRVVANSEPEAKESVEELAPSPPVWRDPFNFAHFNETRRKYADDIDTEAQRLVGKLESVRQAMKDDMAALQLMRKETDAAKAEAERMRQEKRDAELLMEEHRAMMQAAIEARQFADDRINQLKEMLTSRDGEVARSAQEISKLEDELKSAIAAAASIDEALAHTGLSLHEAKMNVERLERAVQERDEELAVQARQIDELRTETHKQREQIDILEQKVARLVERFDDARLESLVIIGKLREGQEQSNDRAEKLAADSETMRRHIVETERARDRLLGQVGQLRAENAGLRAESQVKLRDLETLNNELTANIAVLERMLTNARSVRAQPAPARAQLRLIAEAKKVPGRAVGG